MQYRIIALSFLILCSFALTNATQSTAKAGDLLEQGLKDCDIKKIAAFYTFLEENNFKDFDYTKNAEKFFQCGAAATKLWVEKGNGKNPIDLEKNRREFFPNFFYRAFIENNLGAMEELLKHSKQETVQIIFEAHDNGGRMLFFGQNNHFSCPLKFFELFIKYGASIKGRMILISSGFKDDEAKIRKLLELGADINEVNSSGDSIITSLVRYSSYSSNKTLKVLLEYNPDLSIKNKDNKTAIDIVQEQTQKHCQSNSKPSYDCENFTEALGHLKRHQEKQPKKA